MLWLNKALSPAPRPSGRAKPLLQLRRGNSKKLKILINKKSQSQARRSPSKNPNETFDDARTECLSQHRTLLPQTKRKNLHHQTTKQEEQSWEKNNTRPATGPCSQTKAHVQIKHGKKRQLVRMVSQLTKAETYMSYNQNNKKTKKPKHVPAIQTNSVQRTPKIQTTMAVQKNRNKSCQLQHQKNNKATNKFVSNTISQL